MRKSLHDDNFIKNGESCTNIFANRLFLTEQGENSLDIATFIERSKAYIEEYKHTLNLALSIFECNNFIENGINEDFFLWVLIEDGAIAGFKPKNNNNPVMFQPFNTTSYNFQCYPSTIDIIPYYANGVDLSDILESKSLKKDEFEIVYLNKIHCGFSETFAYYARLYSMINQLFINNVFAKSLQVVLEGTTDDKNDFDEIIRTILNQNGVFSHDIERGATTSELFKFVQNDVQWLGDKIDDAKKNLRADILERLGITHAPYEKKERLINAEIETQDEAIDLISYNMLKSINKGLEQVNKKFKLEKPLSVSFSKIGIDKLKNEQFNELNKPTNLFESEGDNNV